MYESLLVSHSKTHRVPRIWDVPTSKLFEDGFGQSDAFELIIMKVSKSDAIEDIDHSMRDM